MFKKKALILFVLMICFIFISMDNLVAQDLDDEDEDDEQLFQEAQKELAAFHQYSVQYRFGTDLKVGDKVEYKQSDSDSDEAIYKLEVTEETHEGMWIVEKFDGNEVHMLVDLQNKILLDFWGYDEEGNRHEPELLSNTEVETIVNDMIGMSIQMGTPAKWSQEQIRETREIDSKEIECKYIVPDLSNLEFQQQKKDEIKNNTQMLFSNDVPNLLPFSIAISVISSQQDFQEISGGFVKNNFLELKTFIKK